MDPRVPGTQERFHHIRSRQGGTRLGGVAVWATAAGISAGPGLFGWEALQNPGVTALLWISQAEPAAEVQGRCAGLPPGCPEVPGRLLGQGIHQSAVGSLWVVRVEDELALLPIEDADRQHDRLEAAEVKPSLQA